MSYLLYLDDHSLLKIDVDTFKDKLSTRWSSIYINNKSSDFSCFSWTIRESKIDLFGIFHTDYQTVGIDDYHEGLAEFAIWYKNSIVPFERLFVSHDSVAFELEIFNHMDEEQLVKLLDEIINSYTPPKTDI